MPSDENMKENQQLPIAVPSEEEWTSRLASGIDAKDVPQQLKDLLKLFPDSTLDRKS